MGHQSAAMVTYFPVFPFMSSRHASQMLDLVGHRQVLTSVLFFLCFLPCICCSSISDPEQVWAKDNEQVGCHLPLSPYYNVSWTYLRLCQATLQATREKLWGEAFEKEEKPCCTRTESYPSNKHLARDPYIFCNLTRLADDYNLAGFSFCCLQMKVGCS